MSDSNSFSITDGVNQPGSGASPLSVNSQNEGSTVSGMGVNLTGKDVNLPRAVPLGANPDSGGHDRDDIERFIDELAFNAPGLIQTVRAESNKLYPRFHTTDATGLAEAVTRLDNLSRACRENTGLYIQVTTCIENPNAEDDQPEFLRFGTKRGGIPNTSHLLCLWNDIDFGEIGHAEVKGDRLPNPPDADAAHQVYVHTGLPEASVIINSGGGLYEIVLLDEPFDLTVEGNRQRAISVSRRWQQLIEKTAREMGYHYGVGVHNLDRILRVPGTVNTKQWDNKRRATILYNEDEGGVPRYSFDQLEALINELHPEPVAPTAPGGGAFPVERSNTDPGLPGNDFNARGDWQRDILGPAGITYSHAQGDVTYWYRPGKGKPGDQHGFSLNHKPDLLFPFTDSTVLKQWRYFDKFAAYCVAPETKILMADLTWRTAGEVVDGDELVGIDEQLPSFRGRRKLRVATVLGAERKTLPCYRITLADGRTVVCTDEHPWLITSEGKSKNTRWVQTQKLRPGQQIRAITDGTWESATDFDSGWLSGMYDGEGWVNDSVVGLSQKNGPLLDKASRLLGERGFRPAKQPRNNDIGNLVISRATETFRLLGTLRPERLIAKRAWVGSAMWTQASPGSVIESVEFIGPREVAAFMTDTQTFIAEGLVSHNTHLFHGGDFKAAAQALRSLGYGSVPAPRREDIPDTEFGRALQATAVVPPSRTTPPTATITETSVDEEFEERADFTERMGRIEDAAVKKNEARKRVKQLAKKGTNEEERQEERDLLKTLCKLTAGDFKSLYASAARTAAQAEPDGSDGRPVYVMGDELKDYTNLVELIDNGVFPETYVRDGKLVHVQPVSGVRSAKGKINTSTYQAKDITPATLRRLVATYTTPYRVTEKGADSPLPTRAVCESVLDNPEWDGVDTLQGLTDAPFVRADGSICQDHGYDQPTGMWLALPPGYRPVPENPTPDDVRDALKLIMNQVLKDFPFATTADRANAIGMLFTPMIRSIADCAVPLHLINAHTPGTGKTLLAKIAIAAHGGDAYTFPRNSDDELRKQVTSILMDQTSPVVNFDNIASGSTLESPVLAALVTSSVWRDRILGGNTTVALPNDKLWCATGNNIKVNTDISQRSILVHLDAGTERPDLRPAEDFELGDLEQWLLKDRNRAELVRALLVLIRDWAVAGMPRGPQTMRSFTPWAQAIGGLLAHHGISDFMGNTDSVVEADEDKQQDALFLQKWTELVTQEWISASDLITQFETMEQQRWAAMGGKGPDRWQGAFPVRSNGKPYSAIGLGKWLGARKDTPIHGFALRRQIDPDTNRSLWRVERVSDNAQVTAEQTEAFHPDLN